MFEMTFSDRYMMARSRGLGPMRAFLAALLRG